MKRYLNLNWLIGLCLVMVLQACHYQTLPRKLHSISSNIRHPGTHAIVMPSLFPTRLRRFNQQRFATDLRSQMTPVKFQGKRNTCNAFSATALMEFLIKAKTNQTMDLSEAYNYWAGKTYALDSEYLRNTYQNIDGLAGYLAVKAYENGSLLESEWPYKTTNWQQDNNPQCKQKNGKYIKECFTGIPPAQIQKLEFKAKPIFIAREKIAEFIQQKQQPVLVNIHWVYSAVNHQTGDIKMPTPDEFKQKGGHVITLVGYEPSTKRFLFRNSYGPSWGNQGYGTIPEAYILKYCEVCEYLPSVDQYPPEVKDFILKSSQGVSAELF